MLRAIRVQNFMGIVFREINLSPQGVLIEGGNAQGKTSLLDAIRVGLLNEGASPDMIRRGADEAVLEFVIESPAVAGGEVTVERTLKRDGKQLIATRVTAGELVVVPIDERIGVDEAVSVLGGAS